MSQLLSIKSAAMLFVATAVMCFSGSEASAQCRGGGGGGFGFAPSYGNSVAYSSFYRGGGGFNNFNSFNSGFVNPGFNRGVSINIGRSGFQQPYYRNTGFYGNSFGNSFNRGFHGHHHRGF